MFSYVFISFSAVQTCHCDLSYIALFVISLQNHNTTIPPFNFKAIGIQFLSVSQKKRLMKSFHKYICLEWWVGDIIYCAF